MKLLQVISRDGTRLYGAMIRKQAEIRRNGRGTFLRARARKHNAARWTHVRYKGSINFEPGPSEAVEVAIQSPRPWRRSATTVIVSGLARQAFRQAIIIYQDRVPAGRCVPL